MSTVPQPLKYLWTAYFDDGKVIAQPEDDRYSKHDDAAEYNPSSFRDLLEYQEKADLIYFDINDKVFAYGIDFRDFRFGINGTWFSLELQDEVLTDRKLVYFREVKRDEHHNADGSVVVDEPRITAYYYGYEGKNAKGENVQKVIKIT